LAANPDKLVELADNWDGSQITLSKAGHEPAIEVGSVSESTLTKGSQYSDQSGQTQSQ